MATPTLQEFIREAKPLNPDYSDEEIAQQYVRAYGSPEVPSTPKAEPVSTPATNLPTFTDFLKQAKPLNPDYTDAEIKAVWQREYGSKGARESEPAGSDVVRGATIAVKQIPQLAYGLEAGAGAVGEKAFGEGGISTAVKEHGLAGYARKGQEIIDLSKSTDSFSTAYDRAKEGDFGALADWLQYSLGYAGAQAGQMLATAGVGSLAGKFALKPLAEVTAEKLVEREVATISGTEAAKAMTADQIRAMAVGQVASRIGQTAAIGATATGMEGGEIFGDLVEKAKAEGRDLSGAELGKAFGMSLAAGALEFVGDKFGLDLMLGRSPIGKVAANIPGVTGRLVRAGVSAVAAAPVEAATEYGQTLLEAIGKGEDPLSRETTREAVDSAMMGAVGGVAVGGLSGAAHVPRPHAPISQPPAGVAAPPPPQDEDKIRRILTAPSVDQAIDQAAQALETKPLITPESLDLAIQSRKAQEMGLPASPMGEVPVTIQPLAQPLVAPQSQEARAAAPLSATQAILSTPVDEAAHDAATSPANDLPPPTDAQKEAGNYQKGHVRIAGLDISIENPVGSERSGVSPEGEPWSVTMESHYGYILGTKGKDKEHIDVFIKPGTPENYAGPVFVVDQKNPETGRFDEHKVILGAASMGEARQLYLANYDEGWTGIQSVGRFSMPGFKTWLEQGDHTKPSVQSKFQSVPVRPIPQPSESGDLGSAIENLSVTDQRHLRDQLDKMPAVQSAKAAPQPSQPGPSPAQANAAAPLEPRPRGLHLLREAPLKFSRLPGVNSLPKYVKPEEPPPPAEAAITKPRSELPTKQNSNLAERADVAAELVAQGTPGKRQFTENPNGPGQIVSGIASTYPKFYGSLKMKKAAVLRALEKIKQDKGTDVGPTVEKVKAAILADRDLDKIVGAFPDLETEIRQQLARYGEEAKPTAPAIFVGRQRGFGTHPDFDLYNLTADIPGHPKGSTVSRQTIEQAGYVLPARPAKPEPPALSQPHNGPEIAPEGKVWKVLWANGAGVQYFSNLQAASEFYTQRGREASKPVLVEKPKGARVHDEAPEPMKPDSRQTHAKEPEQTKSKAPEPSPAATIASALRTAADAIEQASKPNDTHPVETLPEQQIKVDTVRQPELRYGEPAPIFYSQAERVIEQKMPSRARSSQVRNILSPTNGVKPEEMKWSGLDDFLKTKETVTKQEVLDYLKANQVEIREAMKGEPLPAEYITRRDAITHLRDWGGQLSFHEANRRIAELNKEFGIANREPKFSAYQLPGGTNYRELLLTLPAAGERIREQIAAANQRGDTAEATRLADQYAESKSDFRGTHFSEPNVLAHVRFNDRMMDGKKVLFLEEIQSDWHQKGRREGYGDRGAGRIFSVKEDAPGNFHVVNEYGDWIITAGTREYAQQEADRYNRDGLPEYLKYDRRNLGNAVPDAPFKKTWHELVLRRMLRYAAEHGYDALAWTTGEQQAERYDLSKQVDEIRYDQNRDGTFDLFAGKDGRTLIEKTDVPSDRLEEFVGKDIAQKMIAGLGTVKGEEGYRYLSGLDLKVGGSGMKGFYDDIIPTYLSKYGKKWGAKAGTLQLPGPMDDLPFIDPETGRPDANQGEGMRVHAIDITPSMRDSILTDGQALFQRQAPYPLRPGEPEAEDRQLALFALGDLDKAGQDLSAATGAVARSGGLESSVRTVALGISPDLIHKQVVNLTGYRVTSALDLAKLAQVYRDPRFETFRIFYLHGDQIVGHEGVTSRLPGSVKVFTTDPKTAYLDILNKMDGLHADGYYLLHNHPSGNSDPSPEDQKLTGQFIRLLPGFKGHVIIDSNEYSVLDPGSALLPGDHVKRARIKHDFGEDQLLSPSIPHPLLGAPVFNAQAVATLGKMLQAPSGHVTILYRNFDGTVRGIQEMPVALLANHDAAEQYLSKQGLAFGVEQIFSYYRTDLAGAEALKPSIHILIERGLLTDHVTEFGGVLTSAQGEGMMRRPGMVLGRETRELRGERVEQTEAPYGTEPAPRQQTLYPKPKPDYMVSEPSHMDRVIRLIQDKHIDLRRLVDAIKATGKTLADELNPVYKEEMYAGRAAQASKDFLTDELEPLVQAMRLNRVSQADLNQYLHARHAKEANAYLMKINPDMPQNKALSGMTDEEAARILEAAEKRPELSRLAKRVDAIIQKTRQEMVEYGLESKEVIDKVGNFYKHYIPLDREGFDDVTLPEGQGLSVRGSKIKRRLGSRQKAPNILAHIAMARESTIARGEKLRPVVAMAGLLMTHPNKEIASLDKPATLTVVNPLTGLEETVPGDLADYKIPRVRAYDEETGTVRWMPDPQYKTRDNVVNFRVQGQDYAIVFNEQNDRAMEIAKAFKDTDTPQLSSVMAAVAPLTRYIASVNTQYNPIFGLVNFVRDIQFAAVALSNTPLKGKRNDIRKYTFQALSGIYSDARAIRRGDHPQSATAQLWERFEKVGGPTGYRDLFSTPEDRAKAIDHLLDQNWWQKTLAGRAVTANGLLEKPTALIYQKGIKGMLEWLSDYNQTMENAVRLGVFKAGLEAGMSDIAAASIAKNITVNFNKKGQISSQMGSLYAFFNANVQGTARMFETLFEPGKFGVLSAIGKRIIAGGVTLGVLQAFLLASAGFDEDDPPEWLRARSIIIPVPWTDKGYVSWPMPLGFNFIPNLGRTMAETLIFGKPVARFYNLLSAAVEAFYPLGGAGLSVQTIAPTAVDPLVALAENRDWTGRRIYKEDFNSLRPTPGFTRTKDSASPWAKTLAEIINYATGGTAYTPGKFSPTPDAIDYLVKQAMGGIGRETTNLTQAVSGLASGEEVPFYKVPVLGRFAGSATGASSIRNRFYENVRELNILDAEFKGRRSESEDIASFLHDHPEAGLVHLANTLERDIARLNQRKRDLLAKGAARESVQLVERQITSRMQRFNDRVVARREQESPMQLASR